MLLCINPAIAPNHPSSLPGTVQTETDFCIALLASCLFVEGERVSVVMDVETRERLLMLWRDLNTESPDCYCSVRAVSVLLCHLIKNGEVCALLVSICIEPSQLAFFVILISCFRERSPYFSMPVQFACNRMHVLYVDTIVCVFVSLPICFIP